MSLLQRMTLRWLLVIAIATMIALRSGAPACATRLDDLPICQPWWSSDGLVLWPTPTFADDKTLFSVDWEYTDATNWYKRWFLVVSTDGGSIWTRTGVEDDSGINALSFSRNYPQDHTACAASDALWCTTDGGANWNRTPLAPSLAPYMYVSSLALVDDRTLYMTRAGGLPFQEADAGLFLSTDRGGAWEHLLPVRASDLVLSPGFAEDHTLLLTAGVYHVTYGILKSVDGGRSWQDANTGLDLTMGGSWVRDIQLSSDFAQDQTAFCRNDYTLYKSIDGGQAWRPIGPDAWARSVSYYLLAPHFAQKGTLWLSTTSSELHVSTDAGTTWRRLPDDVDPIAAVMKLDGGVTQSVMLFGSTWENGVVRAYQSFNGGQSWQCLGESAPRPPTPTPPEIPEPAAWLLLGSGLAALAGWARRQAR